MTYKILAIKNEDQIIIMTVEYNFGDYPTLTIDVPVFAPNTIEEISATLINRGISEHARILATAKVLEILPLIQINTEIPIIIDCSSAASEEEETVVTT
jgi:hypothetical protein